MCAARAKVHENLFRALHAELLRRAGETAMGPRWKGHRLFAVDGTKLNLPRPLVAAGYRTPSDNAHSPQGLLSCPAKVADSPRLRSRLHRAKATRPRPSASDWLHRRPLTTRHPEKTMSDTCPARPTPDARSRGVYLDATTTALGSMHERLVALALHPFTFDANGRIADVLVDGALSCPGDPPRLCAPLGADHDARAPGIDLKAARALIARTHLLVTHNREFSRELLEKVLPAARDLSWFEWTYRVTGLGDDIVIRPSPPPPGLGQCKRAVWLLAQPIAPSNRSALSLQPTQAKRNLSSRSGIGGVLSAT